MASLNKVLLIGNLTRDPEVRYTPKGAAVCDISLAINSKRKTEGGETKEEVTFVDCTAWGKTAELLGQYCKKGSSLFIEGRLTTESWEDKATGVKKSKVKVTVENVQFLGGSREQSDKPRESRPPQREREWSGKPAQKEEAMGDFDDSGIPF